MVKRNHLGRLYSHLPKAVKKRTNPIIKEAQKRKPVGENIAKKEFNRRVWGKKR